MAKFSVNFYLNIDNEFKNWFYWIIHIIKYIIIYHFVEKDKPSYNFWKNNILWLKSFEGYSRDFGNMYQNKSHWRCLYLPNYYFLNPNIYVFNNKNKKQYRKIINS